jgi:5'-nucleotidase
MTQHRPRILVTNDDGILAKGIKTLVEIAQEFGEVVVVAPDKPQSGQGHAITMRDPLRIRKVNPFAGIEAYECSGTPVDCVKLAKSVIMKDNPPDLCVSGINHGSNASINIIYSGTMSAAMEASLEGIDAIGFSLLDFSSGANFEPSRRYVREIIHYALEKGLQGTKLLNVNIPNLPEDKIKGIKVCRQAEAVWIENFQEGIDPEKQPYYWLTGVFVNKDKGNDTDVWALSQGYISVVPCDHDLTAHAAIAQNEELNQ